METRNIVIAPCGNRSTVFNHYWLKDKENKNFDLCLLFYDKSVLHAHRYEQVDYFYHLQGFKYPMLYQLLTNIHPEWLNKYDYFYFLDDDIEVSTEDINRLFDASRLMDSWISCAALTQDSYCSWPIFKQQVHSFCRFVGQIEVMAPLFSRNALKKCLSTFNKNQSSWGMDSVWSKILGYPKDKLIVFDQITMKHIHPVGKGELYKKISDSPFHEWEQIVNEYGAKKQNYVEYGRFQLVNKHTNRLSYLHYQGLQVLSVIKRTWVDFDLRSRVMNRFHRYFKSKQTNPLV